MTMEEIFRECDQDFFTALKELSIMLEEYEELTPYQILYEENKPDVSEQMQKNANIEKKSESSIMKAVHAIQRLISNVISSIKNFFSELTMGKDEKVLFNQMEEAFKKDPELKNKKLTVKDFRTISKQYDEKINQLETEIRDCMSNNKSPSQELLDGISTFLKNGLTAGTAILATEVAVKAARSNMGVAKMIQKQLNDDGAIVKKLADALGKDEYNKFKKEITKDSRLLGAHRLLVRLRSKKYENLRACILDTFSQLHSISKGEIFSNIGLIKKFMKNETLGPAIKTAGKIAAGTVIDNKIGNKVRATKEKVTQKIANVVYKGKDPREKSVKEYIYS